MEDLFDILTTKGFDKNKIIFSNNGVYDFIGRTDSNYGIQGRVNSQVVAANPSNCFSLIQIGNTMALWRENEWYASQNIFAVVPKAKNIKDCFLYLQSIINKNMSVYGSAYNSYPTLASLHKTMLLLPIQTSFTGQPILDTAHTYHPDGYIPDWDFMSRYIRAIEKLVIKDVVLYKDEMLQKMRQVIC